MALQVLLVDVQPTTKLRRVERASGAQWAHPILTNSRRRRRLVPERVHQQRRHGDIAALA